MNLTRRALLAGFGTAMPAALIAGCDRARGDEWPGPIVSPPALPHLPIGMNLAPISDYSPGFPFRNLMLGARAWLSCHADDPMPRDSAQAFRFAYDPDGYPLEVPIRTAATADRWQQLFTLLPNVLTAGRYVLLHDGTGEFGAFGGTRIRAVAHGRVVLDMTHRDGLAEGLVIRRSHREDPLRNLRLLREGDDPATLAGQPFLPEMLAFCRPFRALRLMDWLATNNAIERDWAGRRRPTFYTMAGSGGDLTGRTRPAPSPFEAMFAGGAAHELVIDLANQTGIDPWICLPHAASGDYIRECATLYRQRLDPRRRVYVEYSNEVWNLQFRQAEWAQDEGRADAGRTTGGTEDRADRIAGMMSSAFRRWLKAWPGRERARVTTVCAVQAAWADLSVRIIERCHREGTIDAVATGAYFGPDDAIHDRWQQRGAALTADEVIADMRAVLAVQSGKGSPFRIARRARDLGLALVNYEGGQHIVPRANAEAAYLPALKAAQTHPAMYDLYVENLRQQARLGSRLFCAYSSIGRQGLRWGSWGVKESYAQPDGTSPKLRALLDCNS